MNSKLFASTEDLDEIVISVVLNIGKYYIFYEIFV